MTHHDVNKTLKFLQTLSILMETADGNIRTLNDLTHDEKQKISSAIIEYATVKMNIEPQEIIQKLIINRYLLTNESAFELQDANEFSQVLNACGRTDNGSLGIAIAMGDRKQAFQQAKESLLNYKKSLSKAILWLSEGERIKQMKNIQVFFGEDMISEKIVGTISSMLVLDDNPIIDKNKPLFGCALRKEEDVYKISGRASEKLVDKGINLSEAIRRSLTLSKLDTLGGGHPPAAGTKIPSYKINEFLENLDKIVKEQIK